MKKLIILSMILILGISLMVFAQGAQKLDFSRFSGANYECIDICPDANGFVIINPTPDGATTTTIQIQVRGLDVETLYEVVSGAKWLGNFVTDGKGRGKFHCNLLLEEFENEGDFGGHINIWTEGMGCRLLRSEKILKEGWGL